ncbi:hypothetical protein Pyn_27270 [Prunus yedoensis var. nudiflora]|uniref:Uncharacterized protein n=1 Tax=Prunus yedoensis var. nudiflora TaxID=2094558 RepID=A0A314XS48_PRUYE|nr:hypothetical protein Pyn_27270 [Prunus yedoensis var. nudiflora]
MAKGKGKAMAITIQINSANPCKRLVVFPSIAMDTTIHMRYEERNLYRVLVWEVKNMARHEHEFLLPLGLPGLVVPTICLGCRSPLEAANWAKAPFCQGQTIPLELL